MFSQGKIANYSVRCAMVSDADAIIQLLKSIAVWLKDSKIPQWSYLLNGGEYENIKSDILSETTYVLENSSGTIIATFNLSSKQNDWDKNIWGVRNDNAYYLHRLCVDRKYRNQQIRENILQWIDENINLVNGILRLDCVAGNPVLNTFYRKAGFNFLGYIGEGDDTFSKYEKSMMSVS